MKVRHAFITTIVLAFLLPLDAAGKDKEEIPKPPPMAKPVSASVFLGQSVEIPLLIGGRVVEPVTFLIRKPPQHGTLSGLKRTGKTSASVTYTPEPAAAPGSDTFSFAAQSLDSPVSASAPVWIQVQEPLPVLEFEKEMNYGTVFLGDSAAKPLVLRNSGGGVASGVIRGNPPWKVGAEPSYRIAPGASFTVPLVFEPREERDFSERVLIGEDRQSSVIVRGAGRAPVSWRKEGILFSPELRLSAWAELVLTNHTPEARVVAMSWPGFMTGPESLTIPPNGSTSAWVSISGNEALSFDGYVEIHSGNYRSRIPLKVYPTPARLSIFPDAGLTLGKMQKGRSLKGRFTVKNFGGTDTTLQITVPDGCTIHPDPATLVLASGGDLEFEIECSRPTPPRSQKLLIRIGSPGSQAKELEVRLSSPEQTRASLPVETFLHLANPVAKEAHTSEEFTGKVPAVRKADLIESTLREIEISWNATSPEASGFRIERRKVSVGKDDQPLVEWFPWTAARIRIGNGAASARFEHLPENSRWTIRIIGLDAMGNPGPPSPAFQISTQAHKPLVVPVWIWGLLLGAAAAGALRLVIRRRRALLARENERLARLESE
jgi:hypothetical protein